MEQKEVVSAAVRFDSDYLLLEKEFGDQEDWVLAGGSLEDYDENSLAGMLREFEEELGAEAVKYVEGLRGFQPFESNSSRNSYKVYPHDIKLSERIKPDLSDEHIGFDWFSRRELDNMVAEGMLQDKFYETVNYVEFTGPERYDIMGMEESETLSEPEVENLLYTANV